MANTHFIESYFDPSFRVEFPAGSETGRLAAGKKVQEFDAEFKRQAEQKAGRPLNQTELLRGVAPVRDLTESQRIGNANWKPKMAPASDSVYDRLIAEANGEKRLDTSQTREGYINRLRTGNRELDGTADAEAAKVEWAADPFRTKALAELDSLSASFKFDTSRTETEHEAIRQAKLQLETVGADQSEGRKMVKAVFANEDARKQAKINEANSRLADAKSVLANLQNGQPLSKVAPPIGSSINDKLHDLFNKVNEAGGTSRDLEIISEARESGDHARQLWVIKQYADVPIEAPQSAILVTESAESEAVITEGAANE